MNELVVDKYGQCVGGAGRVYVIETSNGVKIGRTINIYRRINEIRTQSGKNITQLYFTEPCFNYSHLETMLLNKFKQSRLVGEWFDVNFEDVKNELLKLPIKIATHEEQTKIQQEHLEKITEFANELFAFTNETDNNKAHCSYCHCPNHLWLKSLSTYSGDECKLYHYFSEIIESMEKENIPFTKSDIKTKAFSLKSQFRDILSFNETLDEMIGIHEDLGIFSNNYQPLKQIS